MKFYIYGVPEEPGDARAVALRGCDAVVFIVDSRRSSLGGSVSSFSALKADLGTARPSWTLQCNKRDLPDAASDEEVGKALGLQGIPTFGAVASSDQGVVETLKAAIKTMMVNARTGAPA